MSPLSVVFKGWVYYFKTSDERIAHFIAMAQPEEDEFLRELRFSPTAIRWKEYKCWVLSIPIAELPYVLGAFKRRGCPIFTLEDLDRLFPFKLELINPDVCMAKARTLSTTEDRAP